METACTVREGGGRFQLEKRIIVFAQKNYRCELVRRLVVAVAHTTDVRAAEPNERQENSAEMEKDKESKIAIAQNVLCC